ncbi:MAG TPA: hypothetical protein RMH99_16560 [Sandaracinaceae bacterium LLY-WYZ-13_1]|nr:hypothetical protein [Sandaracinaceae bacterium LLY-WYZ-13_1]
MDRARYARHLLLAEVGEQGQRRLSAHRVRLEGDPRATEAAADYLARAGVGVVRAGDADDTVAIPRADVARLADRPSLAPTAGRLTGAFAAVEAIKRALAVGRPGALEAVRLSGPSEDRA